MHANLTRTINFLEKIGIPVAVKEGARGFLHRLAIENGVLVMDPRCPPSNALHEAGHLATMPEQYRRFASGDLGEAVSVMSDAYALEGNPDSPLARAIIQCSDPEATAWAWAAGVAIGLSPNVIITNAQYRRTGAGIREMLSTGHYAGIHGLAHAGFCNIRGTPRYPELRMWTHPVIPASQHPGTRLRSKGELACLT